RDLTTGAEGGARRRRSTAWASLPRRAAHRRGRRRPSRDASAARAGGAEPRRRPAAKRDRDLATGWHRDALAEDLKPTRFDLFEQGQVNPPHDLGRHERTRVHSRKAGLCRTVEPPRALRLVTHELRERLGIPTGLKILDGHPTLPERVLRHVDSPGARVGAAIAASV